MTRRTPTRREARQWNRTGRLQRSRRRRLRASQAPPGGLLLLAVAGFIAYHTAPPAPTDHTSAGDLGDRAVGWLVDYVLDVLEVIAEAGGMPT